MSWIAGSGFFVLIWCDLRGLITRSNPPIEHLIEGEFHWSGNYTKICHKLLSTWDFLKRFCIKLEVFCLSLVWFEKFGFNGYSSDYKLTVSNVRLAEQLQKTGITQLLQIEIF